MNCVNKESLFQFLKFSLVGVSNIIVSLLVYYLLLLIGTHYMIANMIGWVVSIYNAFYWNKKYVFCSGNVFWFALLKTYLSYGLSFILNAILLCAFVEYCGISSKIAPVITLIVTVPINFLLNKFWTFREKR